MAKKIIILLFLLTFPSVLYVILSTGKTHFIHLQFYGEKKIASNGKDTIYQSIAPFKLINQDGEIITNTSFDHKIYVASYFFSDCNSNVCQKITTELLRVQEKFMYTCDNVKILSHTMKPEQDSVTQLKKISTLVHADTKMWNFVTGDKKQLYDLAKDNYMFYASKPNGKSNDSIIHNERLVLIDKEKHIRGFYDGSNIKEVNNLLDDIKVLLAEYYIIENEKKKK